MRLLKRKELENLKIIWVRFLEIFRTFFRNFSDLKFCVYSAELNAHIRRLEARVSEVPIDVAELEEMRRANDRLRAEVQRKTERIAMLEKSAADMDATLSRLKEVSELASEAQDEIASLKRQLELKSRALEQANEGLRVAVTTPRSHSKTVTALSQEIPRNMSAKAEEDLVFNQMEGVTTTPTREQQRSTERTPPISFPSLDQADLSLPGTPISSLSSSLRSESSMSGYDPSAAFLEQQQKVRLQIAKKQMTIFC